jgi:predicted RNase H-like HicB family nuclease
MADRFPVIIERAQSGVFSAYVPGLAVYAQGATRTRAEYAIQRTLAAYCEAHPDVTGSRATVNVANIIRGRGGDVEVTLVGPTALVGCRTSERKEASSRANGQVDDREECGPQKNAGRRRTRAQPRTLT